jgi:DNA-3-methyladenine glycosylase II
MTRKLALNNKDSLVLEPKSPYNFDANFHKPSHFPSSDNEWQKGIYWTTMCWQGRRFGLKFENKGSINKPKIKLTVFSQKELSKDFLESLIHEIRYRFNFDQNITEFCGKFKNDEILGPLMKKWKGMKPVAYNSLYEVLMVYLVLQNATVRRSVQMLENLFNRFGRKIAFDTKVLSSYWTPEEMAKLSEQELRELKVGYRARFFVKITQQFMNKEINEFALRQMPKERVREEMLKLYGIGPASADYLLFEHFYFLDSLEKIPPWEQKIMSRLLFNKKLVSANEILNFFKTRYGGWEKLAFHYLWEDLFWKRKHKHIEWLEKEIRL